MNKKEWKTAALRKRRIRRRNNCIVWLVILSIMLAIFALGTLFGYYLSPTEQPTNDADVIPAVKDQLKAIELNYTSETVKNELNIPLNHNLQKVMYENCQKYNVPFALALAVAEKESGFDPNAKSKTADLGIMQINRCNFEYFHSKGIDPRTYEGNIEAGIMLLGENLDLYNDEELAVMAYNCGRTGAKKLWNVGTYSTAYSKSVMDLYEKWDRILEEVL